MWKCSHCNENFNFTRTTEKANHSRWCDKNPKRSDVSNVRTGVLDYYDRTQGKYKNFDVTCGTCNKAFKVKEREYKFPSKEVYYCSRSCSNSVGGSVKALKYHPDESAKYTTVAWRHHEKKCVVCGEDKIVAVHHYNEDHNDNRPENLVPLCPTHHQYIHSNYKHLVENVVDDYVSSFLGNW